MLENSENIENDRKSKKCQKIWKNLEIAKILNYASFTRKFRHFLDSRVQRGLALFDRFVGAPS